MEKAVEGVQGGPEGCDLGVKMAGKKQRALNRVKSRAANIVFFDFHSNSKCF